MSIKSNIGTINTGLIMFKLIKKLLWNDKDYFMGDHNYRRSKQINYEDLCM